MKRLKVGDEFHNDQVVVRVTEVDPTKKNPITYTWITGATGAPVLNNVHGVGSHKSTFAFFEGEGFTYHPA